MLVRLEQAVRVAGVDLPPGIYQLVLTERRGGQGQLCFLAGNGHRPKRLAAVVPVQIIPQTMDLVGIPVIREEERGLATISEIRMATRTLRLRDPAAVTQEHGYRQGRQKRIAPRLRVQSAP